LLLSICSPCLSPLLPCRALPCPCLRSLRSRVAASLASTLAHNGLATANRSAGPPALESVDGDGVRLARAREWRSAGAKHRRGAPCVDCSAGIEPGAQPVVWLCCQLHQASRPWLHPTGEPLHAGAVLPLRGGASQLRPQRDFAGGHLRRHLEGFLGILANWDLWVHLFRAELHTAATVETWVRRAVRAGGLTFAVRDLRRELYCNTSGVLLPCLVLMTPLIKSVHFCGQSLVKL
jgi:hypothetical protein